MDYILESMDMFGTIAENLIGYTFNVRFLSGVLLMSSEHSAELKPFLDSLDDIVSDKRDYAKTQLGYHHASSESCAVCCCKEG